MVRGVVMGKFCERSTTQVLYYTLDVMAEIPAHLFIPFGIA